MSGVVALPHQLSICQLVHGQVIDSVLGKKTRKTVKESLTGSKRSPLLSWADCECQTSML